MQTEFANTRCPSIQEEYCRQLTSQAYFSTLSLRSNTRLSNQGPCSSISSDSPPSISLYNAGAGKVVHGTVIYKSRLAVPRLNSCMTSIPFQASRSSPTSTSDDVEGALISTEGVESVPITTPVIIAATTVDPRPPAVLLDTLSSVMVGILVTMLVCERERRR